MNASLKLVLVLVGAVFIIVYLSVNIHDRLKKKKHE